MVTLQKSLLYLLVKVAGGDKVICNTRRWEMGCGLVDQGPLYKPITAGILFD